MYLSYELFLNMPIRLDFNLFFVTIFFTSCCEEKRDKVNYIQAGLIESIPYQNEQPIIFTNNAGDNVIFSVSRGQGTDERFSYPCSDCCSENTLILKEFFYVYLTDSVDRTQNGEQAVFRISFFTSSELDSLMLLNVKPEGIDEYNSSLDYYVNTQGEFICFGNRTCHDSMTMGNNTYYNVLEIINPSAGSGYREVYQLFYSQEKGILKIVFNDPDNEIFVLQE